MGSREWAEDNKGQVKALKTIQELGWTGKNILLFRFCSNLPKKGKRIDIWWGGKEEDMAETLRRMSDGLKITVFVQNNGLSASIPILLKV